ncbi:MAG: hypothetical protein V7K50_19480 [Nostoc sp.]
MTKVEFTIPVHSVNNTIRQEAETKAKEAYPSFVTLRNKQVVQELNHPEA